MSACCFEDNLPTAPWYPFYNSFPFLVLLCQINFGIAQNFGRVNFWWLVARHAIGMEKFSESSTTGLLSVVYMVVFKNLAGWLAKIRQNFPPPKFCAIRYLNAGILKILFLTFVVLFNLSIEFKYLMDSSYGSAQFKLEVCKRITHMYFVTPVEYF